jgi:hypothetical protein
MNPNAKQKKEVGIHSNLHTLLTHMVCSWSVGMSMIKILAVGLLIPILVLVIPNVYASESNDKRYSDGYSNGSDAAARATVYDVTCDPNNQFTSGGGHTTTYCNGWTNGYIATWNTNHPGSPTINTPPNTYAPPNTYSPPSRFLLSR